TDDCGNSSQTTAIFKIEDTTPPQIDQAAQDMIVECDGNGNAADLQNWLNANAGAVASDVCGNFAWTNDFSALTNNCGAAGFATVIFTATDDCGNTAQTTATFSIEDNFGPDFTNIP